MTQHAIPRKSTQRVADSLANIASPFRGCELREGWVKSLLAFNGSSLEPWRNADAQAQRMCAIPNFSGLPVVLPVVVSGRGGQISRALRMGPARESNFVANEIGGRGYRICATKLVGLARSSRARAREMGSILFAGVELTDRLRSIRKGSIPRSQNESFQSVSSTSEFAAYFARGESPSPSSCSIDRCAP